MGRDNARTPMQWDASPHAGFTTGTPWIAVNPNYTRDQRRGRNWPTRTRCFAHYRRLIGLRHTEPVVAHGDFTMLLPDDTGVYAFTRRLDDVELLVLANFTGREVVADGSRVRRSGPRPSWSWATSSPPRRPARTPGSPSPPGRHGSSDGAAERRTRDGRQPWRA